MNNANHIIINKNRGWRGLAEAIVRDKEYNKLSKMVFSFSQAVWDDLIIQHSIVIQDDNFYYVIKCNSEDCARYLPTPGQQRSVLIKTATLRVSGINKIRKDEWSHAPAEDWVRINHFLKNRNNHTTSDWNCIGIRVIPEI